ncbi:hypothetical protein BVY02_02535, partial [bacterium J17]
RKSLIKSATGEIDLADITNFGRWLSDDANDALLAVCAIIEDGELGLEAFDVLAAKRIESEPAQSILEWVKNYYWEYRRKLVKPVAIISQPQIASDQDYEFAFKKFTPFAKDGSLFRAIVASEDYKLTAMAIKYLGEYTAGEEFIGLLYHPDPDVRLASVVALKGRNELSVLQAIYRAYEREKDEKVREEYRKHHWVTERGKKR